MTTFFLIRHGETFANRQNFIQGTLDTELTFLTPKGKWEAQQFSYLLQCYPIKVVFTSPLTRAVQTSEIICHGRQLPIKRDERLREISYGDWNGMSYQHVRAAYAPYFDLTTNDARPSSVEVNHGESFVVARKRLASFLNDTAAAYPDDRVLVVTHGWVIKTMASLCRASVSPAVFENPHNLGVTRIDTQGDSNWQVVFFDRRLKKGRRILC